MAAFSNWLTNFRWAISAGKQKAVCAITYSREGISNTVLIFLFSIETQTAGSRLPPPSCGFSLGRHFQALPELNSSSSGHWKIISIIEVSLAHHQKPNLASTEFSMNLSHRVSGAGKPIQGTFWALPASVPSLTPPRVRKSSLVIFSLSPSP